MLHYCSTSDHRTFGNLRIDPSNRYITKTSCEILGSSRQVSKQVQQRSTTPWSMSYPSLSAIRLKWKYQQANDNNTAVIAKKKRVNLFYVRKQKCTEGKETFHSNKKRRRRGRTLLNKLFFLIQSVIVPKNKSDYYFLPWNSSFECFFSANLFLFDTFFFFVLCCMFAEHLMKKIGAL